MVDTRCLRDSTTTEEEVTLLLLQFSTTLLNGVINSVDRHGYWDDAWELVTLSVNPNT